MNSISEDNNDKDKEQCPNIEEKINNISQNSNVSINKNNINNLFKLLIDDDYYLISQNLNELLKLHHKSIMQNIGKVNKILAKKNNNDKNIINENDNVLKFVESKDKVIDKVIEKDKEDIKDKNSLIDIIDNIELSHNNFYLNSKKILLKMNKHYNKRKNHLKKYKIIEQSKYCFTFSLTSKLKNDESDDINQINTQKFNNNSNQVIINNIQNIINTIENKTNDIRTNNMNQNDFSSLLKENQLLKQKLTP